MSYQAGWMLLAAVLYLICGLFLAERGRKLSPKYLCVVAVMTALAVIGRILFAALPGFKPVTAVVMLTGMYFGAKAGFLTGAMTPLISNMYFMQGPWTLFQMLAWSLIGVLSALFCRVMKKNRMILLAAGIVFGALYSVIMDIWMVVWYQPRAGITVYLLTMLSSFPATVTYMVSNVLFLAVLAPDLGKRLERVSRKLPQKSYFVNI